MQNQINTAIKCIAFLKIMLSLWNFVTCNLQNSNSYARILFLDFTSAFNTMRVDILLERLISFGCPQVPGFVD